MNESYQVKIQKTRETIQNAEIVLIGAEPDFRAQPD